VYAWPLQTDFVWAKQDFWSFELLRSKLDYLSVRQMVVRIMFFFPLLVFLVILSNRHSDITLHLLNFLDNFKFGGGVEDVSAPPEQELQMLSHVSPSNIYPLYGIIDRKTFENRTAVAHAVSAVEHQA